MWRPLLFICIIAIAVASLFFRRIGDEVRFSRAILDLKELSSAPPDRPVLDAWGIPYIKVNARSGDADTTYFFSGGPDKRSSTLGHDKDDITVWSSSAEWLDHLHYDPVSIPLIWIGIGGLLGLALSKLRKSNTKEAEQGADGDAEEAV
jgi:hypothetical protein